MAEERSHLTITNRGDVNVVKFADRNILEELSISEIGDELSKLVAGAPVSSSFSASRTWNICRVRLSEC